MSVPFLVALSARAIVELVAAVIMNANTSVTESETICQPGHHCPTNDEGFSHRAQCNSRATINYSET